MPGNQVGKIGFKGRESQTHNAPREGASTPLDEAARVVCSSHGLFQFNNVSVQMEEMHICIPGRPKWTHS